ncbi:M23 family metallopeptidase [Sphingomonas sp.]|uniref:M23 family metallopeptidase n=1 Tax=Sphingomonas sp. TaxID=28214 RepID=UPI0025E203DA|nr:M23 family metallopeptidase [Sphingomonas sp.]
MSFLEVNGLVSKARQAFRARDLFFHDGATLRRVHLSARAQAIGASVASATIGLSLFATVQIAGATPLITAAVAHDAQVSRMQYQVASMQTDLAALKTEAAAHAARIDQKQAFLTAILTGKGSPVLPASANAATANATDSVATAMAAPIVAPLKAVEGRQTAMATQAMAMVNARYDATTASLRKMGIAPRQMPLHGGKMVAMGGPFEPVDTTAAKAQPDPQFRALFQSWKRLDQLQQGTIAIPSLKPVDSMIFTSGFGVRSDPFRGSAAMHAGVDMPGAIGTSIYATADGVVARSEWSGGYGNLVEIDHGRGIQTRYGHLSASLVHAGQRVKRGQLIARMGSTGRSTGSHLHYEVRLDGHAVNPMPFLQSASYLAAIPARRGNQMLAMGGPAQ